MDAIGTAKLAIGTRFFEANPQRAGVIEDFVKRSSDCAERILVAINTEADKIGTLDNPKIKGPGIEVFAVTPWGKLVTPLNALILKAKLSGAEYFLSASSEMVFAREQVQSLFNHMGETTLVVGAALEGHNLQTGDVLGNGRTVPWNTFALWNLDYLARTGFLLIGDNPFDPTNAGVEELSVVALLQHLYGVKAKLVAIPGIKWRTDDFDPERLKKHEQKMQSKIERPQQQMEILNIPAPIIIHIP